MVSENVSAADAKVRADVDKFGWHCLNVWPEKGNDHPAFSYTIGLTESYEHPEIMVFGLDEKAHGILNECVQLVRNGNKLVANAPNADVLSGGYDVVFKPIRKECFADYLGTAVRFYGSRPFQALVLFWPNKEGRFPWEIHGQTLQAEALNII